ncbi:hypothetical protein H4219_004856 [Mycoemilia scoparia]|uniref:MYND-type domain-containing protein n=1 Tax=Mycoemilia scoparia TaxID=417184 RepID=A0A9W8DKV6_9FUNG|nr:hypothetical protein H4219_004856 [Mycoemilia scoparia]
MTDYNASNKKIKKEKEVVLGYAEKPDDKFYELPFPSKIGGFPVWTDPRYPLDRDKVTCDICQGPMNMLLQLYAPEDDPPEAFHRLPEKNDVCVSRPLEQIKEIGDDDFGEEEEDDDDIEWIRNPDLKCKYFIYYSASTCALCGYSAPLSCDKCNDRHYCSKSHQKRDQTTYSHKATCTGRRNTTKNSNTVGDNDDDNNNLEYTLEALEGLKVNATTNILKSLFPEFEIVSEPEVLPKKNKKKSSKSKDSSNQSDRDADNSDGDDTDNSEDEREIEKTEDSEVDVDREFLMFQKRIAPNPEQILRYIRTPHDDDHDDDDDSEKEILEPLWVSDLNKPNIIHHSSFSSQEKDIPDCELCGSPREIEFQVMPQLLGYLDLDDIASPSSIDWGTLLIYTCPNSCPIPESTQNSIYAREIVWRQNYSPKGINDRYLKAAQGKLSVDKIVSKQFDDVEI